MLISKKEDNTNPIDGLDVVNVGLNAVLYNTETHEYYTPNTNQTSNVNNSIENNDDIEYNKDNLDLRYNHNHSAKDGRFTSGKNVSVSGAESFYKNVVQGKDLSNNDDMREEQDVNKIIHKQGFDGKPIVIKDKQEFEKLTSEDTVGMYRGIRGETKEQVKKYKDMLRYGTFVPNSDNASVSGKGLYTAAYSPSDKKAKNNSRELAEKYAGFRSLFSKPGTNVEYKDTGFVERFTFTKDVKLYKPKENEYILHDYEIAKKGYDGYYNRNGDFVIILNRTKMIILDE